MPKQTAVVCSCQTHLAIVNGDEEDGMVYIAGYRYGKNDRISWKDRLRWAWKILTTGEPYDDDYAFCSDDARVFAKLVMEGADEADGKVSTTSQGRSIGFSSGQP